MKLFDDLLFFRLGEVLQRFADPPLCLCQRIVHHLFQILGEGLAHRLGKFSVRLGGRIEAFRVLLDLPHIHLHEAFDELLRGDGLLEVVVDAEEGDDLFVFVPDEDAAAFDKFAAVVLREIVVDAVFALILLRLEHKEAEVGHGAPFAASRHIAVFAEDERVFRHRDVVEVDLVVFAEDLCQAAHDRNEDL
ncbi:hypothetical protein SDC9_157312 [bioreactor metagenome]|uniref:Uncharacterized protein n=1 Tax=bioreactor metagenome TaxID=1076179 RepID=A0A645F9L9_9ZZZZ